MSAKSHKDTYWKACCVGFFLLSALTFTPFILTEGNFDPMLAGLPYTLWTSILIGFGLLSLTFIGAQVHRGKHFDDTEDQQ